VEWLFERGTDKKLGRNFHWQTLKMAWCGHGTCNYTGGFVARSLPLDCFPHSRELPQATWTEAHAYSLGEGLRQAPYRLHFMKLISSSESENKLPHQPLSAGDMFSQGEGPSQVAHSPVLSLESVDYKRWGKRNIGHWRTVSRACCGVQRMALVTDYLIY